MSCIWTSKKKKRVRWHEPVALKHPKEGWHSFQPIRLHQTRWARTTLTKNLRCTSFTHILQRRKPCSFSRATFPQGAERREDISAWINQDGRNKLADHCLVWLLAEAEEAWWANTLSRPKSAKVTGKRQREGLASKRVAPFFFSFFISFFLGGYFVFKVPQMSYVFYFLSTLHECSCSKSPTVVVVVHRPRGDAVLFLSSFCHFLQTAGGRLSQARVDHNIRL